MERRLTYFEVVLVRKRVVYGFDFGHGFENLLTHLVPGVLGAWTTFRCKGFEGDGSSGLPRLVEFGNGRLHLLHTAERVPDPSAIDFGAQDSIVDVWQGRVLISIETVKGGPSTFEHQKSGNGRANTDITDTLVFVRSRLHVPGLRAITEEGVRMRLAPYDQSSPSVSDNLAPRGVDVIVLLNEMGSNDCPEKLGRRDGMLLGHDVDGVLHCVCRHHNAVICFCVSTPSQLEVICSVSRCLRGLDISFEEYADSHLYHGLDPCLCILMDFVDSDVVFAILGCGYVRHDSMLNGIREKKNTGLFLVTVMLSGKLSLHWIVPLGLEMWNGEWDSC